MVLVASGSATSVAANSVSADQISGQFQFTGKGVYTLIAKASATGLNCTFNNGGISPASDLAVPFTGTAGTISVKDNVIMSQVLAGGKNELKFRNTTGGAITVDYLLYFDAVR
jgi:hypothetical protein